MLGAKIFLHKIHLLDFKGLSIEPFQLPRRCGKAKLQPVRIQRLILSGRVLTSLSILAVAKQRMARMGKLGADLVSPAGNQIALHQ